MQVACTPDAVKTSPDLADADPSAAPPLAPFARPPSLKPALVVLACVAVVSLGGFALALLGGNSSPAPAASGSTSALPGVHLAALPAGPALRRISSDGALPSDIAAALVVPEGSRVVGSVANDAGVGQFDRSIVLAVGAAPSLVVAFYHAELTRARWALVGTYPIAAGGTEVLARRASADGYEWEVGVVVTPVNPGISPALAGGDQTSASSRVKLRLFQIPDGS